MSFKYENCSTGYCRHCKMAGWPGVKAYEHQKREHERATRIRERPRTTERRLCGIRQSCFDVVHWFGGPASATWDEADNGWYPSSGPDVAQHPSHWMPLPELRSAPSGEPAPRRSNPFNEDVLEAIAAWLMRIQRVETLDVAHRREALELRRVLLQGARGEPAPREPSEAAKRILAERLFGRHHAIGHRRYDAGSGRIANDDLRGGLSARPWFPDDSGGAVSDPRFVEAVSNVKHDKFCDALHKLTDGGVLGSCDCTRDERIAAGLEEACLIAALPGGSHNDPDVLEAFTSASAPKEG